MKASCAICRRPQLLALGAAFLALRALARGRRHLDLSGRVVLITGGSRGLGLVMAREFAARGARIAICSRDPDELERARVDLEEQGAEVLAVPTDLADPSQIAQLVERVTERFGGVDVLVNNAGIIQVGPEEEMTRKDYENALSVHFWGPLDLTRAVLPGMRARGGGRVVNISSIGGEIAVPHLLPYTASKYALTGLSEGLRAELLHHCIYVTTVIPGLMRTGSPLHALFKGKHRAEYLWFMLSDSMPGLSIGAEQAAKLVVDAAQAGKAYQVLGLPAALGVRVHGLAPGLTADLLGWVNRLLPGPGGIGTMAAAGRESESEVTRSWLTRLSRRAARETHQVPESSEPVPER